MIEFTINGKVPSKSNCYRIINTGGHASLCKAPSLKAYEQAFFLQCPARGTDMTSLFTIEADVFYENMRPDLDNCLKIVLDCMQQCRVIRNDRQCVEIRARKLIDKNNPRISIRLEEAL